MADEVTPQPPAVDRHHSADTDRLIREGREYETIRSGIGKFMEWVKSPAGLLIAVPMLSVVGLGGVFAVRDATTNAPANMQTGADNSAALVKDFAAMKDEIAAMKAQMAVNTRSIETIRVAIIGDELTGNPGLARRITEIERRLTAAAIPLPEKGR